MPNPVLRRGLAPLLALLLLAPLTSGCSINRMATKAAAGALTKGPDVFSSDDDPELVRDAIPFGLKTYESLLAALPNDPGLLLACTRGFTQYAVGFIGLAADTLGPDQFDQAQAGHERALRMLMRARDYGLRGLEVTHPGIGAQLQQNPRAAVAQTNRDDVPLLYWTAASWGSLISLSKDDPKTVAEVPITEALIDRALELNEAWDAGAIHTFLISYELVRQGKKDDPVARSQAQFDRAVQLSGGQLAAPFVVMAESVAVSRQDRKQFESLLKQALAIDVNAKPDWRLSNIVMQQRARWLLSRTDELIAQ